MDSFFFFSSRRRHTRCGRDWSSDVCSSDLSFHTVGQVAEVRYDGFGVSGSVLIGVAPGLTIAGWARSDNRLRAKVADTTSAVTDLPRMAGGGILFAPSPNARVAASVACGSWARAGAGAFD